MTILVTGGQGQLGGQLGGVTQLVQVAVPHEQEHPLRMAALEGYELSAEPGVGRALVDGVSPKYGVARVVRQL